MHGQGLVTMSMHEVERMKVVQAVADGHLARWRAAKRLGSVPGMSGGWFCGCGRTVPVD